MRKWLSIGCVTVVVGSIVGYCYFARPTTGPIVGPLHKENVPPKITGNYGDAYPSEAPIEPIIVDHRTPPARPVKPAQDDGPMPRVMLEPGMQQPPRPDAEPGRTPRMPNADD